MFATTNHSAAGVQQALPSANVSSYTPVGGPGAVASDGSLGTLAGSRLTIDFTAQQASFGTTVNFATPNKSFALSGIAGPNQGGGLGDYFGHTSVTRTGTGCSGGSYCGSVSVGLTGTNGYGTAVTAGCLGDIANGFNATFVEVFRKQ